MFLVACAYKVLWFCFYFSPLYLTDCKCELYFSLFCLMECKCECVHEYTKPLQLSLGIYHEHECHPAWVKWCVMQCAQHGQTHSHISQHLTCLPNLICSRNSNEKPVALKASVMVNSNIYTLYQTLVTKLQDKDIDPWTTQTFQQYLWRKKIMGNMCQVITGDGKLRGKPVKTYIQSCIHGSRVLCLKHFKLEYNVAKGQNKYFLFNRKLKNTMRNR